MKKNWFLEAFHVILENVHVSGLCICKRQSLSRFDTWLYVDSLMKRNNTEGFNYTVKKFSEIFPKIVGQLKIQMGHKFFERYSRKYFQHRTGNSSYCLIGEISSLLRKSDIFHNLSGKRSKKSEQIFVFVK